MAQWTNNSNGFQWLPMDSKGFQRIPIALAPWLQRRRPFSQVYLAHPAEVFSGSQVGLAECWSVPKTWRTKGEEWRRIRLSYNPRLQDWNGTEYGFGVDDARCLFATAVDTQCLGFLKHFESMSNDACSNYINCSCQDVLVAHESKATCQQQVLLHVYELVECYPKCRERLKRLNMKDSREKIVLLPLWRLASSMWMHVGRVSLASSACFHVRFVRVNKILAQRPCLPLFLRDLS